jgi:glycosyltransferase involved in cell wall biosynthesis
MKILVSAYACDPYRGSEPGVGWTAVCRMARLHDVYVLTDHHNRQGWERAKLEGIIPLTVQVRFLRDRSACSENRLIAHLQSWMNYASFNRQVLAAAQRWHAEVGFDLCHQVTIATWRMPSPLWKLPVPFVWGPVGGAGYIPPAFRAMLSPAARLFEKARDINTALCSRSPAFKKCIRFATVVIAANEETEIFLASHRGDKPLLKMPVTPFRDEDILKFRRKENAIRQTETLRLFAGGNMEGRKGLSLALRALALAKKRGVKFHYTIGGGGPEIQSLKKLAKTLEIEHMVEFHPGYQGSDYVKILHSTDVYFLPSFRETMGMTLVESIFAGCYPVVADTSAQGEIVRIAGGHAVPVESMDALIQGLAEAIIWCKENYDVLPELATAAAMRIKDQLSSSRYDTSFEKAYQIAVEFKAED